MTLSPAEVPPPPPPSVWSTPIQHQKMADTCKKVRTPHTHAHLKRRSSGTLTLKMDHQKNVCIRALQPDCHSQNHCQQPIHCVLVVQTLHRVRSACANEGVCGVQRHVSGYAHSNTFTDMPRPRPGEQVYLCCQQPLVGWKEAVQKTEGLFLPHSERRPGRWPDSQRFSGCGFGLCCSERVAGLCCGDKQSGQHRTYVACLWTSATEV